MPDKASHTTVSFLAPASGEAEWPKAASFGLVAAWSWGRPKCGTKPAELVAKGGATYLVWRRPRPSIAPREGIATPFTRTCMLFGPEFLDKLAFAVLDKQSLIASSIFSMNLSVDAQRLSPILMQKEAKPPQ